MIRRVSSKGSSVSKRRASKCAVLVLCLASVTAAAQDRPLEAAELSPSTSGESVGDTSGGLTEYLIDRDFLRPYIGLRFGRAFLSEERHTPLVHTVEGDVKLLGSVAGVDLSRYFGVELAADFYQSELLTPGLGKIRELTVFSIIPQLRLRYPLMRDRLVTLRDRRRGPRFLGGQ